MSDLSFVKISAVKDYIKSSADKRTGSDAIDALNEAVKGLLDAAAGRAEGNSRATVKGQDI